MKLQKRLLATILSIVMVSSVVVLPFYTVNAATGAVLPIVEGAKSESEQLAQVLVITSASIDENDEAQTITQGSDTAVNLPKVDVTYADNTTESIDVTWTADTAFDSTAVGTYTYTASLDNERYALFTDVTLPTITVEVKAQENVTVGNMLALMSGGVEGIVPTIVSSGGNALEPTLKSSGGDAPVLTSGDTTTAGTETTITSETFKNYVIGDPDTLWDYTNATTFVYKVSFTVQEDETVDRTFTIDINPHGIENFPYKISGAPEIEGVGTEPVLSNGNTVLTYKVTVGDLTKNLSEGQTSASASFDIGITLTDTNSPTVYIEPQVTFAAAIGNTLLTEPTAKFGVTLVDSKNSSTVISQRHVPHLYDVDGDDNLTPWQDAKLVIETAVTGVSYSGKTIDFARIAQDSDATNGNYSLFLASNGNLYFSDGEDFANISSSSSKITTTINTTAKQLPIGGITYTTYNTLNTFANASGVVLENGSSPVATGLFGYKNSYLESPFSESFGANEHHFFEGSLPTSGNRSISLNISSIAAIIPSNINLSSLNRLGISYITVPSGSTSTITYQQLTVNDNNTKTNALDDVYGVSTVKTSVIPSIVVNIPDYALVDKLTTSPGGDGNIVNGNTEELVFELENIFPNSKSDPEDPFTKTYAGHTLTIEIPETFEVGQLQIYGTDNNEERDFTHFKYYKGSVASKWLEATWVNSVLQLPEGMGNLYGVDKIELLISDTGLSNGQFEGLGGNVSNPYVADIYFLDTKLSRPDVEPNSENRYETVMPIYISAPNDNGTFTKLVNTVDDSTVDDLNLTWHFELPGIPDQDNLTLTLKNTYSNSFKLDGSGDESTVFSAYITQALKDGSAMFNADSRIFKNVKVNIATGQDNHLQLIRKVRIYPTNNSWEFIPTDTISDPDVANNVIIYYTTNKKPVEVSSKINVTTYTDFQLRDDTEYLTSFRIEIDEMQLPASNSQKKDAAFIDFVYADSATISNGDLPIFTNDLTDTLTVEMTSETFSFQKKAEAEETFSYNVDTEFLISVDGSGKNSTIIDGQEHRVLGDDTVINYNIQDSQTTNIIGQEEIVKKINSNFPLGSAIYLQLNPTYFEYIGPETSELNRVTGTGSTKWLRFDISGEDGVGSVTIPKDTILVKEELPTSGVSLFTYAYLDTSALLNINSYENDFVRYTYTLHGVDDTFGITDESDARYGVTTAPSGLIHITDLEGATPLNLKVRPLTSTVKIMSANAQIATGGYLEFGTKQDDKSVVRYYAHESDDLELRLVLSTDSAEYTNVEVKVVVPNESSIMKIGLRGDVYTSFSEELKALVGNDPKNITYYSDEDALKQVVPNSEFSNVKSVKIVIPKLAAETSTAMPIQLKALEADVYSKPDNAQEDVIATTTLTNNAKLTTSYIFDWYELSGIAFSEKTTDTQNGIYDGKDEYLDELHVSSFRGLNAAPTGTEILSYDKTTGKYIVLLQPRYAPYNVVHTPTNDAYSVSTILPSAPLELNNNYKGTSGVNFNASISAGFSIVTGEANLKQEELDYGNVDLALVEIVYTVTFKEDKDATTNVDQYTEVTKNSTIPKTDNTFDIPDDKVFIGWTTDENPTDNSTLWNFNDDGETDTSNDTKVPGDVVLYPVLIDKENSITVTFDTGNIDTIEPRAENNDFVITGNDKASKQIKKGGTIAVAPTTTPNTTDNQEFEFWYIDENNNGVYDSGETKYDKGVTYDKNTIYVAKYKETVNTGTGGTVDPDDTGGTSTQDPVTSTPTNPPIVTPPIIITPIDPDDSNSTTSSQPNDSNSSSTNDPNPPVEPGNLGSVEDGGTITINPSDVIVDENGNITISPSAFEDLPDGEYEIEVEHDGVKFISTAIVKSGVPLSMGEFKRLGGAWSLFDLLSTIFVALTVLYVAFIKKRDKKDEDEEGHANEEAWNEYVRKYEEIEDKKFAKLRRGKTISLAIEAVMAIILLLITQDFTQPMIIFDVYSIAFALAVILAIVIVNLANKDADDEEERVSIEEELERDVKKLRRDKIIASLIDIVLILVLAFITRSFSNIFVVLGFTTVFILCAVLLVAISIISSRVTIEDENDNEVWQT